MKILLTGSSGWLGRHLAPALRRAGHEVTGFDRVTGAETHIIGTVADRAAIDRAVAGHDAVIHTAALHKPDIARYPRVAFVDVNVTGTLNILEAAVAQGCWRVVVTSTTSLMIGRTLGQGDTAVWMDESFAPLEPRNIYGQTKLAAERLCRLIHDEHGLPVVILRTSRFFPEEDDTHRALSGENMKANELLHRRLTVEDAADAHLAALDRAPALGFGTYIVSAPTPFTRDEAPKLKTDAAAVIAQHYPHAPALYATKGWTLPTSLDRVYDASLVERALGWRARTDFAAVLAALEEGREAPVAHDAGYVSPGVVKMPCK